MTEQAIAKGNGGAIAVFGERDDIRELTERLQATMPGGKKLTDVEARSLAQLSLAHGLDPFNGEAWMIPGSGLMVGIKGLRKAARRMARDEGGTYWGEFRRVEPKEHDAPEKAVVFEYHLRDTVTVHAWSKSINSMTSAGVPYPDAVQALGPAPVVVGIGIATPDEKSRMEIVKRSRKRAEADAIKQRYDVAFGPAEIVEDEPVIEADFTTIDEPEEPRSEKEILSELGFDEKPQEDPKPETNGRPFSPEIVKEKLHAARDKYTKEGWEPQDRGEENEKSLRGIVIANLENCFAGDKNSTDKRHTVTFHLWSKASTNDLDLIELVVTKRWLDAKPDDGGAWHSNHNSAFEAKAMYTEALRQEGQSEMELG